MNHFHRFGIGAVLLVGMSPLTHAAICDFSQNAGIVKRMYPTFANGGGIISGTYFMLSGVTAALTLPTGYYFIPNYDNYHEMYLLLLEAAKGQWKLQVKTTNCAVPAASANVQYLVVDF